MSSIVPIFWIWMTIVISKVLKDIGVSLNCWIWFSWITTFLRKKNVWKCLDQKLWFLGLFCSGKNIGINTIKRNQIIRNQQLWNGFFLFFSFLNLQPKCHNANAILLFAFVCLNWIFCFCSSFLFPIFTNKVRVRNGHANCNQKEVKFVFCFWNGGKKQIFCKGANSSNTQIRKQKQTNFFFL